MMIKDWKGNAKTTFATLGASNHTDKKRDERDFYATDPIAAEKLLERETFSRHIWEPACGLLHLSKVFEAHGYTVRSSDIVARCEGVEEKDFLFFNSEKWDGDIITNPPFATAEEFIYKSLELIPTGNKVAMFLRIQFLEGANRRKLFDFAPPQTVYVFSNRVNCAQNGEFTKYMKNSAICYAWFVWVKGYKGQTTIKWI